MTNNYTRGTLRRKSDMPQPTNLDDLTPYKEDQFASLVKWLAIVFVVLASAFVWVAA